MRFFLKLFCGLCVCVCGTELTLTRPVCASVQSFVTQFDTILSAGTAFRDVFAARGVNTQALQWDKVREAKEVSGGM